MEAEHAEEYPPEVDAMLVRLNRDEDILKEQLRSIEVKLASIAELRERILDQYGQPPTLTTAGIAARMPRSRSRTSDRRECPLTDDEIRALADEDLLLTAFAQALPEPKIFATESARWITGAGVVNRDPRSYRVTLRRKMDAAPDVWRKEPDGGYTHIPTEERMSRQDREHRDLGNGALDQENGALEALGREQDFSDTLP